MQYRKAVIDRVCGKTPKLWLVLVEHTDGRTTFRVTEKHSERGLTEQCDCCVRS
jgi:hypothetical protein